MLRPLSAASAVGSWLNIFARKCESQLRCCRRAVQTRDSPPAATPLPPQGGWVGQKKKTQALRASDFLGGKGARCTANCPPLGRRPGAPPREWDTRCAPFAHPSSPSTGRTRKRASPHLFFPTRPPTVHCCSSSGAAVQRYSQQRHLGGIGAPAAAEQPLAIAGALCRARTRVRRARKLSWAEERAHCFQQWGAGTGACPAHLGSPAAAMQRPWSV